MGLFCMLLLLSVTLMGCTQGNQGNSNTTNSEDQQGNLEVIPTTTAEVEDNSEDTSEDTTQTDTTFTYNYEQDLNILDDNYRNYYEIFVYSFCDSDGDGIGDMKGIISKLDYIRDMGFNGIWLMPIFPSPTYHKYDARDFYSIDPQYGTLEDFQSLLTECHNRGIKLIIDFAFNHTSTKHPWFSEAVKYLEGLGEGKEPDTGVCPSVGYYQFTKETNGSDDYHKAGSSDWYYECVFWDQMPDLALESAELRTELENIIKYWLDMGVDGFRLDAIKEYYTGETGKNVEVLKWFSDYVKTVKEDAFIVGECWDTASMIASYYESGITSIFNYPLAQYNGIIASSVRKLGTSNAKTFANSIIDLQNMYKESNPAYIDSPFISNHDNTRVSAQCVNDESQMKMAAGMLLTLNGSPFVYYGEEIGMNSMGDKDENKRLPMNWSAKDTTGITKAPSGADNVVQKFAPLDEQLKKPLSIVNYYKRALRIRNENPEIARGELSLLSGLTTNDVCAFKKVYEGSEIVIVYNINKEATTVDLKSAGLEKLNIRGYLTVDSSEIILSVGVLSMPLYSIVILK